MLENEWSRQKALHSIIGNDEFRNFALGLIEKELIVLANAELTNLCDGRYKLLQIEKRRGHEFYVVDHFAQGEERKASTLSGGETFLVSLALALALSEMSRGDASIESFFIDEGFGSLDKDSMDDVLAALLRIRGRGKQIGIISHVRDLTDRISANIKLNKTTMGHSELSFQFN
jgi:exonuclease SbcC